MSAESPAPFDAARLRDYAAAELARAIAYLAWRGSRMHAGVHQARKSLRRVRATLALGAPALGSGAALIDREVRRINRRLSKLRDAQALVETLDAIAKKPDDAASLPLLRRARRAAAKARAERARRATAKDPAFASRRGELAVLGAGLNALPWKDVTESVAAAAVGRSAQRIEAAAAKACASDDDADWHRWRRRVRRLSQQQRALADMASALTATKKDLKALAVAMGDAQNYALLRESSSRRSGFADEDRRALRALAEEGTRKLRERIGAALAEPGNAPAEEQPAR